MLRECYPFILFVSRHFHSSTARTAHTARTECRMKIGEKCVWRKKSYCQFELGNFGMSLDVISSNDSYTYARHAACMQTHNSYSQSHSTRHQPIPLCRTLHQCYRMYTLPFTISFISNLNRLLLHYVLHVPPRARVFCCCQICLTGGVAKISAACSYRSVQIVVVGYLINYK